MKCVSVSTCVYLKEHERERDRVLLSVYVHISVQVKGREQVTKERLHWQSHFAFRKWQNQKKYSWKMEYDAFNQKKKKKTNHRK